MNGPRKLQLFIVRKQKALNHVEIRFRAFVLHIHIDVMLVSAALNVSFLFLSIQA